MIDPAPGGSPAVACHCHGRVVLVPYARRARTYLCIHFTDVDPWPEGDIVVATYARHGNSNTRRSC